MGLGSRLVVVVSSWLAGAFIGLGRRLGAVASCSSGANVMGSEAVVWRFRLVRG